MIYQRRFNRRNFEHC